MTNNLPKENAFVSFFKKVIAVMQKGIQKTGKNLSLLKTLTIMQLKEKINMSFLRSFRKTLFKLIWLAIEFVLITFVIKIVFDYVKLARIFSYLDIIPISVITIIFTCMFVFSVISSTAGLVKSLYFSRDNMVLLTLPATSSMVFLSKLAVYYIYEFRKNFMFTIPMFIAFGIHKGFGFGYYPWLVFMFLFISALPVVIAALLSIPFMFVYQWIKKFKVAQYCIYALVGAGIVTAVILFISLIPEEFDLLANWGAIKREIMLFLGNFVAFPLIVPLHGFTQLIVGKEVGLVVEQFTSSTFVGLLILLGVVIVLITAVFFLAKPLFYKMASKPFEYNKKANTKAKKNRKFHGFLSALKREILIGLRNNKFLTLSIVLILVLPIAISLLNLLYMSMSMSATGRKMTVAFNLIIILLTLLSTNISMASAYSKDGSTAYLNKIQPLNYGALLLTKLICNLVIGLISTIVTMFVYSTYAPLATKDVIYMGIAIYAIFVAHLFWSAEMDIMNPQYTQYATFSEQANNPNENMSAVLVFLISVIFFVITLFFGGETTESPWLKISIIAMVLAVAKILTYFMKISAFYKEKE